MRCPVLLLSSLLLLAVPAPPVDARALTPQAFESGPAGLAEIPAQPPARRCEAAPADRAGWYRRMTVSAAAAWPAMEQQFKVQRGFDPLDPAAMTGQLIRLETDNLMGWRFKVGDFPFATTVQGLPVAAIYDPAVADAIAAIEAELGRALGDSDDDGRWTIIAEVTGRSGQMQRRVQVEGEVRDAGSGQRVGTYRGEEAETVEAPILRIVAAHIGPLAVAAGVGRASADGTLERVSGNPPAARSGEGPAFGRFSGTVLLLLGALLVALQGWPERAAARAAATGQTAELARARRHLPAVAVGVALAGGLWLLVGGVVGDLLPALALTGCGVYGALPALRERLGLPPVPPAAMRVVGAVAGVGTVLLALLHLGFGQVRWL